MLRSPASALWISETLRHQRRPPLLYVETLNMDVDGMYSSPVILRALEAALLAVGPDPMEQTMCFSSSLNDDLNDC